MQKLLQTEAWQRHLESEPLVDEDLLFAAEFSGRWGDNIRSQRTKRLKVLQELGRRWAARHGLPRPVPTTRNGLIHQRSAPGLDWPSVHLDRLA